MSRPKMKDKDRKKPHSICLPSDLWRQAKATGNVSECVTRALSAYFEGESNGKLETGKGALERGVG